ncbi:MAG: hypothetical protein PHG08_01165 [Bacilli bacterium]|nr:hypothetical protein [Bacilli bacterium]
MNKSYEELIEEALDIADEIEDISTDPDVVVKTLEKLNKVREEFWIK